jgi:hypothetical protein
MNTLDEQIEILIAIKEDKEIQVKIPSGKWDTFYHMDSIKLPNFYKCVYRIKPEPMVKFINIYHNSGSRSDCAYRTLQNATSNCGSTGRTVKFIEVI